MNKHIAMTAVTAAFLTAAALAPLSAVAQQDEGASAPESHDTTIVANKGAKRMVIQTDAGARNYSSSTTWQQVTGSATVVIPSRQRGVLVATFTGESNCSGTPGHWCSIRIRCDGVELEPDVGTDFAFNSVGTTSTTSGWKSLSVTRRSEVLSGGSHTCGVYARSRTNATHRLDDWTFVVEYWRTN